VPVALLNPEKAQIHFTRRGAGRAPAVARAPAASRARASCTGTAPALTAPCRHAQDGIRLYGSLSRFSAAGWLGMADMVAAVRRMSEAKRAQYSRLVGVRALTGCTKSIVELVSADLFLQLNGMDYARTARIMAALTTINTVSDFMFNPLMGGLLDAYGRKVSLLAAQVLDGATALLVGVRPSVPNFVVWQLLREFSRRANKPARLAMMGDFVGRASADFVHLYNFAEVTLLRHIHIPTA
jgi:hypothetical protein